jgi:hypothetical protein
MITESELLRPEDDHRNRCWCPHRVSRDARLSGATPRPSTMLRDGRGRAAGARDSLAGNIFRKKFSTRGRDGGKDTYRGYRFFQKNSATRTMPPPPPAHDSCRNDSGGDRARTPYLSDPTRRRSPRALVAARDALPRLASRVAHGRRPTRRSCGTPGSPLRVGTSRDRAVRLVGRGAVDVGRASLSSSL